VAVMTNCRYCDATIDLDTLNDIWRNREDGVVTCRSNHKKSSYRWTHLPKVKEKV
jgi:hypothetical protein